jgi:hypothetical protein
MDLPQKASGKEILMSAQSRGDERGIVTRASTYTSVPETLERLRG